MTRDELIKATQQFFFEAMLKGYLGNATKFPIHGMPGMRALRVKDIGFELLDQYCRQLGSRRSFGETIIWYKNEMVWVLQYRGEYEKRAIPLLKLALARAYEAKKFNGGRGLPSYSHPDHPGLIYTNLVHHWEFVRFNGRESIHDNASGQSAGWHEYNGLFLL